MSKIDSPLVSLACLLMFIALSMYAWKTHTYSVLPVDQQHSYSEEMVHKKERFVAFKIKHYSEPVTTYTKEQATQVVSLYRGEQ